MECTDTSDPYRTPFLLLVDGQNDSNTGTRPAAEGTVASRIRFLNERDRKPQEAEKNVSQPKSVLDRAPPAIREADQSLSPNPQRLSPFVRRTAERLPTPTPPVHSLHANIPVHSPTPKVVIQRPTFFDISPGSDKGTHATNQWQKPGPSHLARSSNESSSPLPHNAAPRSEIRGTSNPQHTDLSGERKNLRHVEAVPRGQLSAQGLQRDANGNLVTTGQKQNTKSDNAGPFGVTLRKSQAALEPAHSKPESAKPGKSDSSIGSALRKLRPISPSIGIGPRNTTFGRAGGRYRPDEPCSSPAVEGVPEAHAPESVETHENEAAALAKVHDERIAPKRSIIPFDSVGHVDTENEAIASSIRQPSQQGPLPSDADTVPTFRQEQLDRIHAIDTVIKRQSNLLQGVIRQLKGCGPRLEEIRTLSRGLSPKTRTIKFPASETFDLDNSSRIFAATPVSDSSTGWEVHEGPERTERTRTMSFPDALLALNDAAETVSSLVKDIQPAALTDIPRAQSLGDNARRTQSLPKALLGPATASLLHPVQCPDDLITPRPHTVNVQPHFDWLGRPSATSRYTLTPPPGQSMGKAMSHAALRNALPTMLPPTPQDERPPVLGRRRHPRLKLSTQSNPSVALKHGHVAGHGLPKPPSSTLSSASSISQFSFRPTPPLYFSYQQLPTPADPETTDQAGALSLHGPPTAFSTADQQSQQFFSHVDNLTPSSASKDSPPPPPPKFMGFDPTAASPTTGGSSSSKRRKAQSDCGIPIGSSVSSIRSSSLLCESCGMKRDAKMGMDATAGVESPAVAALSPVEESPETSKQVSQDSVPQPSSKNTSQPKVQTAFKSSSPVFQPPLTAQLHPAISQLTDFPTAPLTKQSVSNGDLKCLHTLADPKSPPSPPLAELSSGKAASDYVTATQPLSGSESTASQVEILMQPSGPPPDATPASAPKPKPNPEKSNVPAQPSEADTTAAAPPSTRHTSTSRRPLPRPLQNQHEDSDDARQQTKIRIEQWRQMVPAVQFASQPVVNPFKPASSSPSPLPLEAAEHLDVRTRVRLLEAARRVKELEMEEDVRAAAAAAAAADVLGENQVCAQTANADIAVTDAAACGGEDEAPDEALFKGGANEQIGALEKPFW
ncbi:hypothetical protein IWZ01DRAFT_268708 [Phyllosticta capitalensis]